ncbi:hypothetical protein DB88DRAFT_485276 [Papiliotrema laurentii]|uniref:Uncharacterized protein n=1 Tax=Papiliotrema laurentii TaxID=5418 RepID=A0AAD9FTG1_PAPLA|nr:hypothetical protein DB88DRAFT_485276 [Papiliotrema laurentii]
MNQALSMVWQVLSLQATEGIHLLPFVCRLLAFLLAAPFAICIVLDIIAYAIVRTLHLSMSQQRIPRSPLSASVVLESDMEPTATHVGIRDLHTSLFLRVLITFRRMLSPDPWEILHTAGILLGLLPPRPSSPSCRLQATPTLACPAPRMNPRRPDPRRSFDVPIFLIALETLYVIPPHSPSSA